MITTNMPKMKTSIYRIYLRDRDDGGCDDDEVRDGINFFIFVISKTK